MTGGHERIRTVHSTTAVRSSTMPKQGPRLATIVALLPLALSSACTSLLPTQATAVVFDLGDPPALEGLPALMPGKVEVLAPSWLDTSALQYRLAYQSPPSRNAYAASKWAAPPAEMLQRMIARTLRIGDDPANPCRLKIELDEFVHVFSQPQVSEARLFARAELSATRGGASLASNVFEIDQSADSPDARGGIAAHQAGVAKLLAGIATWLTNLGEAPNGPVARCRIASKGAPDNTKE